MSQTPEASVEPLDVDGVLAAVLGTILFAVAAVVLFALRSQLESQDRDWWFWTALTGVAIGLLLTAYTIRRRSVYRAARAAGHKE